MSVSFAAMPAVLSLSGGTQAQAQTAPSGLCTPASGSTTAAASATCGPGTTTTGISYSTTGPAFSVSFAPNTVVNTASGDAVNISGASTAITVDAPSTTVFRSGIGGDGIFLPSSAGGSVTFGGLIVSENFDGIHVEARTAGAANAVAITTTSTAQIYSSATSLLASSTGGNIAIVNAGAVTQGNGTVTNPALGTITVASRGGSGIATSTSGAGTTQVTNSGSVTASGDGIRSTTSGTGTIGVTNSGAVRAAGSYGIYGDGQSSAGLTLSNASGGTIQAASVGIQGSVGAGRVSVSNAGSITAPFAGLVAGATTGPATAENSGTVAFGRFGILAGSVSGLATVTNSGTLTATGAPGAAPTSLPPVVSAGLPASGSWGVFAATGVSPTTVLNAASGRITADIGLEGRVYGLAQAVAAGLVPAGTPVPATNGPLSVDNRGTINAVASGIVGRGFAPGSVSLSNAGTVTMGSNGSGIYGTSQSTTAFGISNSGTVAGGATGVLINHLSTTGTSAGAAVTSGATTVSNLAGGTIRGSNTGIDVVTYNGAVTIQNAGAVIGGDRGIVAGNNYAYQNQNLVPSSFTRTSSALTIENRAGGTIGATSDQALRANWTGPVNVSNAGTLTGYVAFGPNSSAGTAPAGVTGPVIFDNLAGGVFAARGNSSFNAGNNAVFNNAGTVSLAGTSGPASVVLSGLSTFNNTGTISLVNGFAGDTLTINGNYVGQNGSLNTEFSTQASAGDRLVINGNASGTTSVTVTNLTGAVPFTTGAPVVVVNGTTATNAFVLRGLQNFGTLEPILVTRTTDAGSDLALGQQTVAVATIPNAVALSGPTAVIAARSIATQGSSAVLDRVTQLRGNAQQAQAGAAAAPLAYTGTQYAALVSKDPIAPNLVVPAPAPASNVKPAVWARAFGDLERRTGFSTVNFNGASFGRDLGYSQATGGLLAGADVVISGVTAPDDGVILGVMGGYTVANVRLNQAAGRQDYDGGTVGAYATYLKGGFFADALFKTDILGLDITAPGLRQSTGLMNYNALGNVGYRFELPHALYIEPTAGLEYVATVFDRTPGLTATTVPLQNGDALRGRIGARLGTEFVENNIRVEPSITGLIYDTFTESGTTATFGGGTRLTGLTNVGKVRGEIQASINFFNLKTGLSGFLRADYRIGDDLIGGGGRAGIRYQW